MDQTISIEKMYQKKTQLEHILLRPDTYVGAIVKTNATLWILEEGNEKFTHKEIEYVPGLYKIFDEILVNAADNYQRGKNMDTIKVTIDEEKGLISVWNNGSGIPVQIHKEYDIYVPELIFGHLLTSSNYDDTQKKVTGGRNGYGAKLTNIFSKKFIVETADSKSKKSFKMTWRNNMSNSSSAQINPHSGEDYTCISFEPDLPRFQMDHLEKDTVALMRKRVYDLAGVISSNVRVYLNGKKIPIKGFQQYVDMYIPENALKIREKSENERWEVIVSISEGQFQQVSFVNSICTSDGGTHVKYISEQITDKLIETIQKKHKDLNIKPFQVKHHIWVFINSLIENPAFSSQTKESLTTKATQFGSKCDLSEKFMKSLLKSGIVDQVIASAKAKTDSKLAKALSGTKKSRLLGIDKLEDANDAGTRNAEGCTLILTEGDSAKALAMSGIEIVGRDKYGVFPLKGKFLNVREANAQQIMKNEEVQNLIKIMGLQVGKQYNDKKSLRYGSVMIMADQDADGSHIKGLIINFVHHFWPSLTKMSGFLRQFITPIIKATKGKNASQEKVFFTLQEFRRWADQIGNQIKSWKIKYYKGLGTSTDKEAKEYFNAIGRHQIDFEYVDQQDDDSLSMAFSKKMANARKEWLANYDPEVEIDYNQREIRYQDFINKELIHFSNYDNIRAIPSVCDGFKPGQRKIMFSLFNRKSKEDAKVAQLSGYVAAYSAYHHGEQSLASTIVGLAQTFVGSNNINLLMPVGQFGSRNAGGKDAASSRYIFTNVSKVTRYLFPPPDDHLLKYLDDDGQSVEPEWYIPIIPLVLVNGSEGIGTGWSTSIPCYNPYELVENMKRKLQGEEFKPMHPWYKGYCGEIEQAEKGGYIIRGKYDITDDDTIEITEIPVTKWWTRDYKKFLEGMVNPEEGEPEIDDMKEYHANDRVHFIIKMREGKLAKLSSREDVEKKFKLTTQMQTTNMVLFNAERKLKKYDKVEDIMQEFYDTRLKFYGKRKDYLMSKLQRDIEIMTNKKRFILAVIAEDINIRNVKKKLLIQELLKKGYTPMKNMTKIKSTKKQEAKAEGDDAQQEGEEEKENAEEQSEDDQTISAMEFNYLLSMPIWSLTYEKVEELKKQLKNTEEELVNLQKVKIEDMWLDDLDKFVCVLKEVEEEQEQERMKGPKAKGGGKMIKKKPKKKKVESSDDEHNKSKIEESAKKGAKDKDNSMILETAKKPAKKKVKKDDDEMEEEKKEKPKQKEGKDKDKDKEKDKDKDKDKEKVKEKDKKNKENQKKPEKEEEEKKNSILKYLNNTPSFKDKEKENTKKRHREEEDDDEQPFLSLTDRLRLREQKGDIKTFHSAYENVKNQYLGDFDEESQTRAELIDNRSSKKNEEKENQSSFGGLRALKKARMDLSDEDPVKSEKVSIKFDKVSVSKSNVSQNSMSEILMSKQKVKDEYKREKRSTTAKKKTVFSSDEDDNYGSDDDDFQPEETYY